MKVNLTGLLRQAAAAIDPERDQRAYAFMLGEVADHVQMVRDGKATLEEFAELYGLRSEAPASTQSTLVEEPVELVPATAFGHWHSEAGQQMAAEYATKARADLMMGDMPDFELANRQYLASRDDLDLIHFQTAAKERIRWLSVKLALSNPRSTT